MQRDADFRFARARQRDASILRRRRSGAAAKDLGAEFEIARASLYFALRRARRYETRARLKPDSLGAETPVDRLMLRTRTHNILNLADLSTWGDVAKLSKADILKLPNAGKLTVQDIKDMAASYGVAWG